MKHINTPIHMNGYKVSEIGGGNFYAVNDNETVRFLVEGRNGGLYFKPIAVTRNNRYYRAERFLFKYIRIVREIAFQLADNDYIWDYWAQAPLLETRKIAP